MPPQQKLFVDCLRKIGFVVTNTYDNGDIRMVKPDSGTGMWVVVGKRGSINERFGPWTKEMKQRLVAGLVH